MHIMSFFSTCWCSHCILSVQLVCIVVWVRPCPSSLYFLCILGPEIGREALIMRSCIAFPLLSAIQSGNTHKGGPGALKCSRKCLRDLGLVPAFPEVRFQSILIWQVNNFSILLGKTTVLSCPIESVAKQDFTSISQKEVFLWLS